MKKFALLFFALAFVLAGSAAQADPVYLGVQHITNVTIVDGKTDYFAGDHHKASFDAINDYYMKQPGFDLNLHPVEKALVDQGAGEKIYNASFQEIIPQGLMPGTLTLFSDGKTGLGVEDESKGYRVDYETFEGKRTFPINPNRWGRYNITNPDGFTYYIEGNAETALSGQSITYTEENGTAHTGKIPAIITTANQMNVEKCVPYVEFIMSGNNVTGFKLRFVDPSDTSKALTQQARTDMGPYDPVFGKIVVFDYRLEFNGLTDSGGTAINNLHITPIGMSGDGWPVGDLMENTVDFADIPGLNSVTLSSKNLEEVAVFFKDMPNIDVSGSPVSLYYSWGFDNFDAEEDLNDINDALVLSPVDDVTVASADQKFRDAGLVFQGEFKARDNATAEVNTQKNIFINDTEISDLTSSALVISQDVGYGNALVAGKPTLQINRTSFGDAPMPTAATKAELRERYTVIKYFQKGGSVDLLEKYPDIFEYPDDNGDLAFLADLVIIDGPVPSENRNNNTVDMMPFGDGKFGTKVISDDVQQFLYVYDGLRDGYASDPIALVAKPQTTNGGGGCSVAGLGFGAAALAALALALGRRRA